MADNGRTKKELNENIERIRERIKELKTEMIVVNVAVIILGVVMIIIPKLFTEFVGQIIGGALCIWGVLRCITFLRLKENEMFGSFALVQGAAMIGFGIFFLTQPYRFTSLLNSLLALAILVAAVFKLQNAINYMKLKIRFWWLHLIISLVLIAFGVIAIVRPGWVDDEAGLAVLMTVITGVAFVISGVWDIFSIAFMAKALRKNVKEMEDAGVIPKKVDKRSKNVVKLKEKDVTEKEPQNAGHTRFTDPELDSKYDDFGDNYNEGNS